MKTEKCATWNYATLGAEPTFVWFEYAVGRNRAMTAIAEILGGLPEGLRVWPGWDEKLGIPPEPKGL